MGYGQWLHGEAVAAGMVVAADVSRRLGRIDSADVLRLATLIARAGLPAGAPALGFERWMTLMGRDKKVVAGAIRFVLLDALGRASVDAAVPDGVLRDALRTPRKTAILPDRRISLPQPVPAPGAGPPRPMPVTRPAATDR